MRILAIYAALLLAAMALPIVVVVLASFTTGEAITFPPKGLGLRWYALVIRSPEFVESIWTSLQVAGLTSLIAGLLGASSALALARHRFRGALAVDAFLTAPLAIPSVGLGLALLIFYTGAGIAGTKLAIVAGHVLLAVPFVLRLVRANFAGYNWNLERAAANLGASPWRVFRHVTLPLVLPGILGGMIFAFIISFDDVVIALFLAGPDAMTLPVRIYTYLDQSPGPIVLAASSILIFFAIAFMALLEATVRIGRAFGVSQG